MGEINVYKKVNNLDCGRGVCGCVRAIKLEKSETGTRSEALKIVVLTTSVYKCTDFLFITSAVTLEIDFEQINHQ
jgi:hypothetical protein